MNPSSTVNTQFPERTSDTFPHYMHDMSAISREMDMISAYYADKRASRSKVPLINHIDEGLAVLNFINASTSSRAAFCLHPMAQADADLTANQKVLYERVSGDVLMLVMEYRSVANAYLSHRSISHINEIKLSPLKEVNDMLIADKVQNYKDFIRYHHGTHPRSDALHVYFRNWLERLSCHHVMTEFLPEWESYYRRINHE